MPSLCRLEIIDCNKVVTVPHGLKFVITLDFYKVQHVPSIILTKPKKDVNKAKSKPKPNTNTKPIILSHHLRWIIAFKLITWFTPNQCGTQTKALGVVWYPLLNNSFQCLKNNNTSDTYFYNTQTHTSTTLKTE